MDDQRNGLSQQAGLLRGDAQANSAVCPPWVKFTQSLYAQGVKGPVHKDLFARSRLADEAKVSFEYFKAYAHQRASQGGSQLQSNRFLNNIPHFRRLVATCPNLRRSHVGLTSRLNTTGFRLIQFGDMLNGLSGMSMNSLAFRNQHSESRNSLIYRWTRVLPALVVNALGAYVVSRGITSLVKGSALEGTALDDYKGAYMTQIVTYAAGACMRTAAQMIAKGADQDITTPGLHELEAIFYSTLKHMRSFHRLINQDDGAYADLQTVFQKEFGKREPLARQHRDLLLSNFKDLPIVNLESLSSLVANYMDVPGQDEGEVESRSGCVTRLFQMASNGLRSEEVSGDVSLRNHVETFFHNLWTSKFSSESPSVLHGIRQRPETPGDLPRALVSAGDKSETFAGSVAFSLDCIPGRYVREKIIEHDQRKLNPKVDPVTAHAVAMMLNVAAYGILAVQIARSSKADGYNITPSLPSEDDFEASLSATSLLILYMSFSVTGLVMSTLGAGLEKLSKHLLQAQANTPEAEASSHLHANPAAAAAANLAADASLAHVQPVAHTAHQAVLRGNLQCLVKAFTFLAIGSTLPMVQGNDGKQPTALLGVLSTVFLGLGADQLMRMKRGPAQ